MRAASIGWGYAGAGSQTDVAPAKTAVARGIKWVRYAPLGAGWVWEDKARAVSVITVDDGIEVWTLCELLLVIDAALARKVARCLETVKVAREVETRECQIVERTRRVLAGFDGRAASVGEWHVAVPLVKVAGSEHAAAQVQKISKLERSHILSLPRPPSFLICFNCQFYCPLRISPY